MNIEGQKAEGATAFSIQMFSRFSISDGSITLTQSEIHSDMAVKLLVYLIFHHDRSCTVTELSEALWPDEGSSNPAGALKNMAYRLRTILKKVWPETEFIQTGRGSYAWNAALSVKIDTEEFKRLYQMAKSTDEPKEKIKALTGAFECYRGRLLPDLEAEHWIMPRVAYYQSQYLNLVKRLAELLEANEQYHEMERVCIRALDREALDEKLHILLIRAYIAQGKLEKAESHYHTTEKTLYDSLGIGPSDEMRALYQKVMDHDHDQVADISVIQDELSESELDAGGAFYCEFGIFKRLYELEVRRMKRMGMTVFLALLTLYTDAEAKSREKYLKRIETNMDWMRDILTESLRAGDVYTRYSVNQYLVMLPACPYENAKIVMERIFKNFERTHRRSGIRMKYSMKELEWLHDHEAVDYPLNRNASVLRLCIDRMDELGGDFSGYIVGMALKDRYHFGSSSEFLLLVERLLDQIGNPQASKRHRSFEGSSENRPATYRRTPDIYHTSDSIEQIYGRQATYDISFESRNNNTWQGVMYDDQGQQLHRFESALELIQQLMEQQR